MNDVIESDEFDVVRKALEVDKSDAPKDNKISLDDVQERFVDFKTAYCKDDNRSPLKPSRNGNGSLDPQEITRHLFLSSKHAEPYISLWLDYKVKAKACKNYDCDGARSARIVPNAINILYDSLWGLKEDRVAQSGDTMNSLWTTYAQALKLGLEEDSGIADQLDLLAYLTHTLGNFIPCHGDFNNRRAGFSKDYWDITMLRLKDFFLEGADLKFNPNCISWLNSFGKGEKGWDGFVEQNYLRAYLDENGNVIRFYEECPKKDLRPSCKEQLRDCLLSMNAAIIARGNKMGKELEEKINKGKLERADWKLFFKDPYPQSSSSPR